MYKLIISSFWQKHFSLGFGAIVLKEAKNHPKDFVEIQPFFVLSSIYIVLHR